MLAKNPAQPKTINKVSGAQVSRCGNLEHDIALVALRRMRYGNLGPGILSWSRVQILGSKAKTKAGPAKLPSFEEFVKNR